MKNTDRVIRSTTKAKKPTTRRNSQLVMQAKTSAGWDDVRWLKDNFQGLTWARSDVLYRRKKFGGQWRLIRVTTQILPVKA